LKIKKNLIGEELSVGESAGKIGRRIG